MSRRQSIGEEAYSAAAPEDHDGAGRRDAAEGEWHRGVAVIDVEKRGERRTSGARPTASFT